MNRRDAKALLAFYTPDFDDLEPEGQHLDRADIERLTKHLHALPGTQDTARVVSIDVSGPSATIVYLHYARAMRSLDDGTMARVEVASRDRDHWSLIDGTWYLDRSVVDARDVYVEDRLYQHVGTGEPVDP